MVIIIKPDYRSTGPELAVAMNLIPDGTIYHKRIRNPQNQLWIHIFSDDPITQELMEKANEKD